MKLVLICLLLPLLSGCTAGFAGQWLEDGVKTADGSTLSPTGEKRMALNFDPVSTVWFGRYSERGQVVDEGSVQSAQYFVHDGWHAAQFGSTIARVNGDHMDANVNGGVERHFTRVKGVDIFPPTVQLPPFNE
jgi:hypothetical protein